LGINLPRHQHYVDPISYAETLVSERNSRIREGYAKAVVAKVLVYRGLPSNRHQPEEYARNLTQAAFWQRDPRVTVTHRALKYSYLRDENGLVIKNLQGHPVITGKQEKGIDVLCALALVREARKSDLVILSSQDTDLIPALNEAASIKLAKIETSSWYLQGNHSSREIRSEIFQLWNTRLGAKCFENSRDRNDYSTRMYK
jgi:uncharacterized LabA/DUF88 family protein